MAELQVTIEISVELNRFFNVDLFQRGYYQVQISLKTPLKSLARVEISDNKINALKEGSPDSSATFKQSCTGKSRKFQILYRNEEVDIGDIFIFRIHTLVESTKLEKNLEKLDLRLEVQLWCNNEEELMDSDGKIEQVSSRDLMLHLSPTKGLHHSIPVLFDYFHLSAIEVVIHGTVVAIHQPYFGMPKSQKTGKGSDLSTLEAVYFGQKVIPAVSTPSNVSSSSVRLQQAHLMHKTICSILLSAHESLQNYLLQYAVLIPGNNFQLACKDCLSRLGEAVMRVQGVLEEDDLIQTALTDITQLCAENVLLWTQFLEIVLKQPRVHLHLAAEHHSQRVRRFAEGFFTMEHNKSSCLSCYDPCFHGHSSLASTVKSSPYFCNLPPLSIECIELDGDENSLPVIFEDIFHDTRASPPQVYKKALQTITNSSITGSSNTSSVVSDRATPPHIRRRLSTKRIIKNMNPEGFKCTSSYYCRDTEAACAKLGGMTTHSTGVTLLGYRKISAPDALSAGSNLASHPGKTLSTAASFPTAYLKYGWEEPAPDPCHPPLIALVASSEIGKTVAKPSSSDETDYNSSNHVTAFSSVTLAESPCIYLKQALSSRESSLAVTSKPPIPHHACDSVVCSTGVGKSPDPSIRSSGLHKSVSLTGGKKSLDLSKSSTGLEKSLDELMSFSGMNKSLDSSVSPINVKISMDSSVSPVSVNKSQHSPVSGNKSQDSPASPVSVNKSQDSPASLVSVNKLRDSSASPVSVNKSQDSPASPVSVNKSQDSPASPVSVNKSQDSPASLVSVNKSQDSPASPINVNKSLTSSINSLGDEQLLNSSFGVDKSVDLLSSNNDQSINTLPTSSPTAIQMSSTSESSKLSKQDLNRLDDDMSKVLREKYTISLETVTADVTPKDDGDNLSDVANGLHNEKDLSSVQFSSDQTPAPTGLASQPSAVKEQEWLDQVNDIPQEHGSNNNSSALQSETCSQEGTISSSSPSVAVAIAQHNTALMTVPVSAAAAVTLPSERDLFTDPNQTVAVMEPLKEEHIKSVTEELDIPVAGLSTSQLPLPLSTNYLSNLSATIQLPNPLSTNHLTDSTSTNLISSSSTNHLPNPPSTNQSVGPSSTNQLLNSSSTNQLCNASSTNDLANASSTNLPDNSSTNELASPSSTNDQPDTSSTNHLTSTSSTSHQPNPTEPSPFSQCQRAASDSDILKNCEDAERTSQKESLELLLSKTNINGREKRRTLLTTSSSYPELSQTIKSESPRLVSVIGHHTVNFVQLRESLKLDLGFAGNLYSECPVLASSIPYFQVPSDVDESSSGIHLIVCVHGLDGNSADLRLVRTFIEMALPGFKLEFLMSERNQQDTFADFDKMTDKLVDEILTFLETFGLQVTRISFVGHSLGNVIIRSTLSRPEMAHLLPKLYTLLSLSGPHLGTLYNTSGLVNMGMWFMQKLKKSGSLLQLSLKDHSDPRQSFLYRLSQKPVLQNFKHVLLVGSHQDRYVPYHSSRIEICRSAQKDTTVMGAVYREMVQNILEPIIQSPNCTLIRYDVFHALPSTANTMIGRAAHIAVLDSEIFIEKFLAVTGLKYFQ